MAVAPTYATKLSDGKQFVVAGDRREVYATGTVGAADTYATGGFALAAATLGFEVGFDYVAPVTFSTGHWGIYTGGNIKVFSAAATELVNASAALQNATFDVHAIGK